MIGTLNATTLIGEKLGTFLGLAEDAGVDVLCVQETRMAPLGFQGAANAAKLKGWHAWFLAGGVDALGRQTQGLATFSRWPARRIKPSLGTPHHALAVVLDIPDRPPVVVYNHYGDPRCGATRDEQVLQIVADMATQKEESVIIGDFNQTPDEFTITDLVIKGVVEEVDLALGNVEDRARSTRRTKLKDGTVREGRHIDYAIATPGMRWTRRSQYTTSSDHDLVAYEIRTAKRSPAYRRTKPANLARKEPVTDPEWYRHFDDAKFRECLDRWDAGNAFALVSELAEELLDATGRGRPRHVVPAPTKTPSKRSMGGKLMSIAERRLFKLAGQLRQIHRRAETVNPMRLRDKAIRGLAWAQGRWEDLEPCTVDDLRTLVYVENLAARIGKIDKEFRLQEHCRKMETDLPAAQRWANMPIDYDAWVHGESVDPQGRADDLADKWRDWWQTSCVGVDDVRDILRSVEECPGAERPKITGEALMRIVKASNGKAAFADGWSPTELCLLPDGFFEAVALIWEVVLQGAALPPSWKAISCVGIPKGTGGLRPLSISSIFWRCGSTALLSKMSVWIDEWAPHELAGGLRGRCADSIHESLERAWNGSGTAANPWPGPSSTWRNSSTAATSSRRWRSSIGSACRGRFLSSSGSSIEARNGISKWPECAALARYTRRGPSCRDARGR